MSRIKVFPGHGAAMANPITGPMEAKRTMVELPFTELTPSIGPPASQALQYCQATLDRLSPHQRDVVLANLLSKYGAVVPR